METGKNDRYRVDRFHAGSLEGNPLQSPVDRDIHIYLPPGYYDSGDRRYPVVYQLHGYNSNAKSLNVPAVQQARFGGLPPNILDLFDWSRSCDYVKLDELIARGELKPFIMVQPDASLYLHDKYGTYDFMTNDTRTKGSFYINSPYTGNYEDYTVNDIVSYIDAHYRTLANSKGRALMGTSMGGYGVISILCRRPGVFSVGAALSPANFTIDIMDWKMLMPMAEKALGRELAEKICAQAWEDFFDTMDLIYSRERPLIPSVVRNDSGKIISYDKRAYEAWSEIDLNNVVEKFAGTLKQIPLLINCEMNDDLGIAVVTERLHETLEKLKIKHEYELYSDPVAAALSAHTFGIAYKVTDAIGFCLRHIEPQSS